MQFERIDLSLEREHTLPKLSFSSRVLPELLVALDTAVILGVAFLTYEALIGDQGGELANYVAAVGFVWLTAILLMNFAGLYRLEPIMRPLAFADKLAIAFLTTFLFMLAAAFSIKISESFSRLWVGSFAAGAFLAVIITRLGCSIVLGKLADRGVFTRHVVVVGAPEQMQRLLDYLKASKPRFISVIGSFLSPTDNQIVHTDSFDKLARFVRQNRADDIVLAFPWSQDSLIVSLVERLRELPVNVYLASDLIGFRLAFQQSPDHFGDMPVVEVMGRPFIGWSGLQKRLFDLALTGALLPVVLPLMAIIAVAIKLESGGPVFFRQERYGFSNDRFLIWKFRTMRDDRARHSKTIQATPGDLRVTSIGKLLRRSSLDELPQFINVLSGTMSLVGPRPHAVDHNEDYARIIGGYFARHRVKPGITGWAQVNGLRGATRTVDEMEARVKHDIYYTENWSLLFDVKILAMTFVTVLSGRNAY
jgi:putative colanic acid biosynthesis UDP-glucose lipid carrier transferase